MAISNDDMIKEIKEYCKKYDYEYSEIKNDDDIIKIYNLLICDIISPINNDDNNYVFRYYGIYYDVKSDSSYDKEPSEIVEYYQLAEKYYLTALEMGNIEVTNNLGDMRCDNDDYDDAKKYYLMGAENGNAPAMYNLGFYYRYVEQNYELMKKYYLMAIEIENGSGSSSTKTLVEFADYYKNGEKNYALAIKYYLMVVESIDNCDNRDNCDHCDHRNCDNHDHYDHRTITMRVFECCKKLGSDYNELITYIIKYNKYDIIKRHHLHKEFLNHTFTTEQIGIIIGKTNEEMIDAPPILKLLKKTLHTKVDIMDLHFKYSMKGEGFKEAKTDFINKLNIPKK